MRKEESVHPVRVADCAYVKMKWKNGFKSVGKWLVSSVLFSLFPLAVYYFSCWVLGPSFGFSNRMQCDVPAITGEHKSLSTEGWGKQCPSAMPL